MTELLQLVPAEGEAVNPLVRRYDAGQAARAVIKAEEIAAAARVVEERAALRLVVVPDRIAHVERRTRRKLGRLHLHQSRRELARQVRRVGLLDLDVVDQAGGEQVEGHDPALRLGAGQQRVVQRRPAIAGIEAAHEHEIIHGRHARDLLDGLGSVGRGAAANLLGANGVRDSGRQLALDQHRLLGGHRGCHRGDDIDHRLLALGGHHGAGVGDLASEHFQTLDVDRLVMGGLVTDRVRARRDVVDRETAFDRRGRRDGQLARHLDLDLRDRIPRAGVVDESQHAAVAVLRLQRSAAGCQQDRHGRMNDPA